MSVTVGLHMTRFQRETWTNEGEESIKRVRKMKSEEGEGIKKNYA
jgi:hypothetical protein